MINKKTSFLSLARVCAQIALNKKATAVKILSVRKLTSMADYFIIATAESAPQIKAILDSIHKTLKDKYYILPVHMEGRYLSSWAVIDYGGLVVHVMLPEARNFYAIDKMWIDARKVKING